METPTTESKDDVVFAEVLSSRVKSAVYAFNDDGHLQLVLLVFSLPPLPPSTPLVSFTCMTNMQKHQGL